jgi:hypothetical protein
MPKNKSKKESGKATLAGVKKEMAEPRIAKSAREKDMNPALAVVLTKGRRLGREEVESQFEGEILKK